MSTTLLNGSPDPDMANLMASYQKRLSGLKLKLAADREAGEAALRRLLPIAQRFTGQGERVARLLLGCYNGRRFPMDLTNLRSLDYEIMEDCLAVLRMDANCRQEVHQYFDNGGEVFEQLAKDWCFENGGDA